MHLPHLLELEDRFELAAVCDISEDVASECARAATGAGRLVHEQEDMLTGRSTPCSVLPPAATRRSRSAAASPGRHVFVEKPMCLNLDEGREMAQAAERAGVRLMVGTMKRYDPAYERMLEVLPDAGELRLVRVTTLESPFAPYIEGYALTPLTPGPPELLEQLRCGGRAALTSRAAGCRRRRSTATAGCCSTTSCTSSTRSAARSASRAVALSPSSRRRLREHQPRVRRRRLPPVVGRPAGDRPLQAGAGVLRARCSPDTDPPVAVSPGYAERAGDRARGCRPHRMRGVRSRRSHPSRRSTPRACRVPFRDRPRTRGTHGPEPTVCTTSPCVTRSRSPTLSGEPVAQPSDFGAERTRANP